MMGMAVLVVLWVFVAAFVRWARRNPNDWSDPWFEVVVERRRREGVETWRTRK